MRSSHSLSWIARIVPLFCLLAIIPACRVTDLPLWQPGDPPLDGYSVQKIRDVAYIAGPTSGSGRQRLDLFLPEGKKHFPVVLLIHGGAWLTGDNRSCGLYSSVGEYLAREGIGVAMPNYRLSPEVRHPEHIRDVARAFAWVRAHIAEYGGDPSRLIIAGHSAGGHLAALLATDETYLGAEGTQIKDIRGVIAISGVYRIPEGPVTGALGGPSEMALHLSQMLPLRGGKGWARSGLPGIPLTLDLFWPVFGNDPEARAQASPITHVRPGLPPFLLLYAENDLPLLGSMAEEFAETLRAQGNEVTVARMADRNHNSIIFQAMEPADPVAQRMVAFIRQKVGSTGE